MWPPATIAAAVSPPATTSMASSTLVTGRAAGRRRPRGRWRPGPRRRRASPAARPRPAAAPGVPRTRAGQPKRRARTRLQSHQPPTPRAAAASRPMMRDQGGGHVAPGARQLAEAQGPGLHELAAHVDRLGRLADLRRAPCAASGVALASGSAAADARRSPRRRWTRGAAAVARRRSRSRPGPAAAAGAAAAAVVGGARCLPAPRAARRPRWSTSRQPVYSSESVGSCVERLLVLRLRVGAVDVLVAAGVAQQLGHAALGAGRRGRGQARGSIRAVSSRRMARWQRAGAVAISLPELPLRG